MTLCYNL